jgi:hypothetical protein
MDVVELSDNQNYMNEDWAIEVGIDGYVSIYCFLPDSSYKELILNIKNGFKALNLT